MLASLALGLLAPLAQGFDPDPENMADRWIVVFNRAWPDEDGNGIGDSEDVARWIARRRGIPAANLLPVDCTTGTGYVYSGQSGWEHFFDEIVTPLRNTVSRWSDENHVLGFVLCYGVPYQLSSMPIHAGTRSIDSTLIALWTLGDRASPKFISFGHQDAYFDPAPGFGTDPGRFDPAVHRRQGLRTYLVSRLDGLDAEHACELVEMALYGDAYLWPQPGFHSGNAYCDTRYGAYTWAELAGYPFGHDTYADADKDMAYGRQWLEQAGFPLFWEPFGTEIGEAGATWDGGGSALTAPEAILYEGWYNYNKYLDVWDWKVGSAACDLNSNSVARLRQENPGTFLGTAFQRGLACGPGVIAEPYLNGHAYPEVFAYYLVNGYPFGEAARISDPKAKWVGMYVGDPFYQPLRAGKTPLLDTVPPPPCTVLEAAPTATAGEWRIRTALLPAPGALPDLATLELAWGPDPFYGSVAAAVDPRPRVFHTVLLTGLGADELIHYRPDQTDPAGNLGSGPELVLDTALATAPVSTHVLGPAGPVAAYSPLEVEVSFGAASGFGSLTTLRVTVTAAHLGWNQKDVSAAFLGPQAVRYGSADDTVRASRLLLPGGLAPGSYLLEVDAAAAAGADHDALSLLIQ
ncbi:MAG: TIGR03790 family protein [Planctomycetota bacterium]|nr:MAG: TIGR03790 family protein [Planctomycetota bacterium]